MEEFAFDFKAVKDFFVNSGSLPFFFVLGWDKLLLTYCAHNPKPQASNNVILKRKLGELVGIFFSKCDIGFCVSNLTCP